MSLYLKQIPLGPMENFVYLVGDSDVKKCWVVDPAWDIEKAEQMARKDGYALEGALITHAHYDHCNAVQKLLENHNIPVYVHKRELDFLNKGAPPGLFLNLPPEHVKPVESGDKISLGGTSLTFLHTPGHTPGSQCFLVGGNLVSGDTLFLGSCGRCDMPGGNPYELYDTLNQKIGRLPDSTVVFPGHNYSSRGTRAPLGQEKELNRFFKAHTLEDFLHLVGF